MNMHKCGALLASRSDVRMRTVWPSTHIKTYANTSEVLNQKTTHSGCVCYISNSDCILCTIGPKPQRLYLMFSFCKSCLMWSITYGTKKRYAFFCSNHHSMHTMHRLFVTIRRIFQCVSLHRNKCIMIIFFFVFRLVLRAEQPFFAIASFKLNVRASIKWFSQFANTKKINK